MRSHASFKGHPIHPMLIPFPIAFLTGAFVFDVISVLTDNAEWSIAAMYLAPAGVLMGLVAAIPGLIDFLVTVPPDSSAKKRATLHLSINVSALTLFAISVFVRGDPTAEPGALLLLLEGAGMGLLGVGGWLGGTLAYRNQIGVDHRYAAAGKWRDEPVEVPGDGPVLVGHSGELEVNQMKLLRLGGERIVLARTEEGYVAFDDHCTHRGGSLAGGVMICGTVQCPWHGSQFDTRSGAVKAGPATRGIHAWTVEARGREIWLHRSTGAGERMKEQPTRRRA
jgi:uncharacterized membrane protein/nitrite reductase/ring-hydroxylating ferredoxin subunit